MKRIAVVLVTSLLAGSAMAQVQPPSPPPQITIQDVVNSLGALAVGTKSVTDTVNAWGTAVVKQMQAQQDEIATLQKQAKDTSDWIAAYVKGIEAQHPAPSPTEKN